MEGPAGAEAVRANVELEMCGGNGEARGLVAGVLWIVLAAIGGLTQSSSEIPSSIILFEVAGGNGADRGNGEGRWISSNLLQFGGAPSSTM